MLVKVFGYRGNSIRVYDNNSNMIDVMLNEGLENEEYFTCLSSDEAAIKAMIDAFEKGDLF